MLSIKAESYLLINEFEKGRTAFNQTCHLYNRWKGSGHRQEDLENINPDLFVEEQLEFGVDDYIKARAGLAECLMNSGRIEQAISKFEGVKKRIKVEVVFDKPILLVNTCNQLGNCYLKVDDLEHAKTNFEESLLLIRKLEDTSYRVCD